MEVKENTDPLWRWPIVRLCGNPQPLLHCHWPGWGWWRCPNWEGYGYHPQYSLTQSVKSHCLQVPCHPWWQTQESSLHHLKRTYKRSFIYCKIAEMKNGLQLGITHFYLFIFMFLFNLLIWLMCIYLFVWLIFLGLFDLFIHSFVQIAPLTF